MDRGPAKRLKSAPTSAIELTPNPRLRLCRIAHIKPSADHIHVPARPRTFKVRFSQSHPLGLRARSRRMISNCRRRHFGPAGILGFQATVTPRLSGSVTLSRWSHRFSIAVESTSCRTKVPSAPDRPHVSNGGSIRTIRFFSACVNFFRDSHTNAA
jgi:hypothetical protein